MSKFQHDVMLRIVKILNVLMIELPFAACWVGLAGVAVILDDILRLALFGEAFLLPPVF